MAEPKIVKTADTCGGRARLDGHRLTIAHFVQLRREGDTDADILKGWDYLNQAQLDAVWAYYAENRDEIDDELRENYRISAMMGEATDASHPTAGDLAAYFAGLPADMRIGFTLGLFDDAFQLAYGRNEDGSLRTGGMGGMSDDGCRVQQLSLERVTTHEKRSPEITPANARAWLKETLEWISESWTAAGWRPDIEYRLWNDMTETDPSRIKLAQPYLSDDERIRLKWLVDKCGGWFHFVDGQGLTFIPMEEWQPLYEEKLGNWSK